MILFIFFLVASVVLNFALSVNLMFVIVVSCYTFCVRCLELEDMVPRENPMACQVSAQKAHLNEVKCCKTPDFCNNEEKNLPKLGPSPVSPAGD